MKTLIAFAFVIGLISTAHAADPKALVGKYSGSGYISPEWATRESCEVFDGKVVITKQYGRGQPSSFSVVEERPLTITAGIRSAITASASGNLHEMPNNLCDGPSTQILAFDSGSPVLLYTNGGCGSPMKIREGAAALMLKDLVGRYCPYTAQ